jgi:hypothetical protein
MKSDDFLEKQVRNMSVSLVFWHGMKCSIFENLLTTTNIESYPLCVLGIPNMKSMLTASHDLSGMGNG